MSIDEIRPLIERSWSAGTSRHWRAESPACGQCNVTALVVHDLLGGEIAKTEAPGGWHYYNLIGGERHDLTASQFAAPIAYSDVATDRAETLAGTAEEHYERLRQCVERLMDPR